MMLPLVIGYWVTGPLCQLVATPAGLVGVAAGVKAAGNTVVRPGLPMLLADLAGQAERGGEGPRETGVAPGRLLPAITAALCAAEAIIAAGLVTADALTAASTPGAIVLAEAALAAAALLTVVLAAAVAAVIRRGTEARCPCFGAGPSRPLGRVHLVRNLGLLAMIGAGLAGAMLTHGRPAVAGMVVAATAGALAALVFIRWEDLAELFAPIPRPLAGAPAIQRPSRWPP
jgi:Methylamine utilisation protein MauE